MDLRQHVDEDDGLLEDEDAIALQLKKQVNAEPVTGVSKETHNLVMATMAGGEAWRKNHDAEALRLREARLKALKDRKTIAVRSVGVEAMLECIRHSEVVVVHISDNSTPCLRVDKAMADLDQRMRNSTDSRFVGSVRPVFLRLDAADAGGAMHEVDTTALPALLIYHAHDLASSHFNVHFHDADDLEDLLDNIGLF